MAAQNKGRYKSNKPLTGKTAIVTGASSGIGKATAMTLAQAGAAVVIQARRKDRLVKLASDIEAKGRQGLSHIGRCQPDVRYRQAPGENIRMETRRS